MHLDTLNQLIRRMLGRTDVRLVRAEEASDGTSTVPAHRSDMKLIGAGGLSYAERARLLDMLRFTDALLDDHAAAHRHNAHLLALLGFAAQVLRDDVDSHTDLERLFSFLGTYGPYALVQQGAVLINSGLKPQHIDATRAHLDVRPHLTLPSVHGTTLAVREPPFDFMLVTKQPIEPVLKDMIRGCLNVLASREQARKQVRRLTDIRLRMQRSRASTPAESDTDALRKRCEELEHQLEETLELALTDSLTRCYNRRKMQDVLEGQVARSPGMAGGFCLVMLDVDHFKAINDTHGHDVGDRVLVQFTELLRRHLRASDTLSRWGGEEFVIVLPRTEAAHAAKLCERLRAAIAAHNFGLPTPVTASFGYACHEAGMSAEDLVKAADEALHRAKQEGRNRVCGPA